MATFGQIIFYSLVTLIVIFAAIIIMVLVLAFTNTSTGSVMSSNTKPITNISEDVLLSCNLHAVLQDKFSDMSVTWQKDQNRVVYRFQKGAPELSDQASEFKGRARMSPDDIISGNASLLLRSVRSSDAGEYTCSIQSSYGSGKVTVYLRTAAYSTPTFTFSDGSLTAEASRWFPKPTVKWQNETGSFLGGNMTFSTSSSGLFTAVSTLQPVSAEYLYTCTVQNELVAAVSEVMITGSVVNQRNYFSFSVASPLLSSLCLNMMTTLLSIYCVA
ncbi:V-set domain-containing T-cell activation inhibitor 1 isoform X2 [Parambassis ranga]|uniref:V-set domain-containing T-cell activation inhibitor 1 isoform X2 n=1 Tax=Parambassis ranga TaxID=210632 RepID=A0A6P7H6E9_9TELE|nr:V-set domain-containing T-cell activation inhibitor 1 isoform X2 [Parambassis ranga]